MPFRPARGGAQSSRHARLTNGVAAGFYEAESHRLVDIHECPVLVPELAGLLAPFKTGLAAILAEGEQAELHATASDTGVDLSLKLQRRRDPDLLMALSRFAADLKVARLCWNGEPVVVNTAPQLRIGRFSVSLPPESFLQPSKQGERVLQQLATAAVGSAQRIADLFCGCGSFTFAFAGPPLRRSTVRRRRSKRCATRRVHRAERSGQRHAICSGSR